MTTDTSTGKRTFKMAISDIVPVPRDRNAAPGSPDGWEHVQAGPIEPEEPEDPEEPEEEADSAPRWAPGGAEEDQ